MLSIIYKNIIKYLSSRMDYSNLDIATHQRIISDISAKYFNNGELGLDKTSTLSIMIRRSIAQFLGSRYWNKHTIDLLIRNAICIFLIPILTAYYFLIHYLKNGIKRRSERATAVLISDISSNLHTDPFKSVYPDRSVVVNGKARQLAWRDIIFITNLIKCFYKILFYPELLMRVIQRIAQYSFIIEKMNCETIVTMSAEGSPWSSILTAYCRTNNIEHVQIMHGIRYFSSSMAFAEFDKYYIWGQYHFEEFKKMYVRANSFIVVGNLIHQAIYRDIMSYHPRRSHHKLLICFNPPITEIASAVLDAVKQFEKLGWMIGFRPHPGYIKESSLFIERIKNNIVAKIDVDSPGDRSLLESVKYSDVILASTTNALTDAWIAGGKCIYIDSPKIPLQEYHHSKNIKVFRAGDDLTDFILSPVVNDVDERNLKNRFSYNYDSSRDVHKYKVQ